MLAPLFQLSNPQFGHIGCSEWQFFSFPHQKLYSWTPSLSDLKHTMRVIYIWSKAEYRIVFQFPPFYMKNAICISLWTYVFRYIHSLTKYNKACCCKRKKPWFLLLPRSRMFSKIWLCKVIIHSKAEFST